MILAITLFVSNVGAAVLRNADIVALINAGVSDDVIVMKIQTSGDVDFDVSVDALLRLKDAHAHDVILSAMLQRATPHVQKSQAQPIASIRFGEIFLDLPGWRTHEGTVLVDSAGIRYSGKEFQEIYLPWEELRAICFEEAYFATLYLRGKSQSSLRGPGASMLPDRSLLHIKYTRGAVKPLYEYLKKVRPMVVEDCSDVSD